MFGFGGSGGGKSGGGASGGGASGGGEGPASGDRSPASGDRGTVSPLRMGPSGAALAPGAFGGSAAQRATIEQVRGYWEGLRRDGALPSRGDIDPRGLHGALSGSFVVERIAPGLGRLRIAGMSLVDLMGMEVRGMPISALFDPAGRVRLAQGLEQVFQRPAILEIMAESESGLGRPPLTARIILLPLAGNGARPDLALGCMALEGDLGRRPRRLSVRALQTAAIGAVQTDLRSPMARIHDSLRMAAPPHGDQIAPLVAQPAAKPGAVADGAFDTIPTRAERPYLRLVKLPEV